MKFKLATVFWVFLIALYFFTRLINLKIIPIFTDEAIYSYWAQVALNDPANRFISLEDGKQPLFIWIAAIFQNFITDPLVASRLVSVFAGFGSLIGIYLLANSLFNDKTARWASFLYIILPFTLLYDRLALFDSLLTMFGIYAVFFSIRLARNLKLETAMLNGFAIGFAMITKSSGFIFLYLLPFSLLFFNFKEKNLKFKFLKWFTLATLSFFLSQVMYNSLRLSPLFYIIERKNLGFIRSFSEVISNPFLYFYSNFMAIIEWIIAYVSWPLFLLFMGAVFYGIIRKSISIFYLSIIVFAPFLAELLFNKVLYPRFVLFYFPYIIILIAFSIFILFENFQKYRKYLIIIIALALIIPAVTSFKLLTNPTAAKIANSDAGQYLNSWPAGYGVSEITQLIRKEAQDEQVYVGTEGTFGLLPYALQIYFFNQNNVHLIGFWPVDQNDLPEQIIVAAKKNKTYFIFNENQKKIENPNLKFIAKYRKGKGESFMRFYEVISQ